MEEANSIFVKAPVLTFSLHVKYKNSKKKPGKRQIIQTINNTLQSLTITWCSHVLSGFVTAQDLFTWCVCCNSNFFSKRVPQRGDNLLTRFHIYDTFLIKLFAVEYPTTIFYYWIFKSLVVFLRKIFTKIMLILQHFVEKKRTRPHCFKINMGKIKSAFYIEIKKNLV